MIYIYFQGTFLDFSWFLPNRPRSSDCIHIVTPVFHLCNVIPLFQAAGAHGRCGHFALQRVVLEHRREPVCVSDWLEVALLVWVLLHSDRIVIPIHVQVS